MPTVSFCFSTYKRGETLKATLESVRRQTFTDYEVIVSDNDPECSGKEYVAAMDDHRFRYFPNGGNLGMKASFNKSLERSRGEYIVMIADDDPVYHDMLETLMQLKEQHPGYGMYMGGCDWFCEDHEVAALYNLKVGTNSCISQKHNLGDVRIFSPTEFLKNFYSFNIFSHFLWSTCMVKREVLLRNRGIPDYGSPFLGDYAYMSIAAASTGCVIINRSLGCQTIHRENFGRNQNEQLPVVVRNFPEYLDEKLAHLPEWPTIYKLMLRFVALWVIEHMTFLHNYSKKDQQSDHSLALAEKEVFKTDFMKPYRFKYYLKKKHPLLHGWAVKLKSRFKLLQ